MNRPAVHYFLGNAVTMLVNLAGLVLFARVFTPAEYGRLSVLTATIGLLGSVGTMGLPQSAVRYYWDFQRRGALAAYNGTLLGGSLAAAVVITVVTVAGSWLGEGWAWGDDLVVPLTVAALVIGLTCLAETLMNVFRAGQDSKTYSVALVLGRGAGLLASAVAVLMWGGGVVAYLWGQVAGEVLLVFFLLHRLGLPRVAVALGRFDSVFFSPRSATGFPMSSPSSAGSCSAWGIAT